MDLIRSTWLSSRERSARCSAAARLLSPATEGRPVQSCITRSFPGCWLPGVRSSTLAFVPLRPAECLSSTWGAAGGLQITASHNPIEWNGLKPFAPDGSVFNRDLGQQLIQILDDGEIIWKDWSETGNVTSISDPSGPHIERVLKLVDETAIRKRNFKVVLDCNHGSGATCGPRLLEQLGCEVVVSWRNPRRMF